VRTFHERENGLKGCGDACLNRLTNIECGPRCKMGMFCGNTDFQECNYSACSVKRADNKGFGLFADRNIAAETFIIEYVGEVVNAEQLENRKLSYDKEGKSSKFFMQLRSGQFIDPTIKGNLSRFVNHSCDPNATAEKWLVNGEVRIGMFSKRDISAGEEITIDYQMNSAQECLCGSAHCRGSF